MSAFPDNNMSLAVRYALQEVEYHVQTARSPESRALFMDRRDALQQAYDHLLAYEQEEQRKWREENPAPKWSASW